ncbi:Pentatricopeptide repeat-containing protein [Fagus crenata]
MFHSYRLCDSSPCVFDLIFKTLAHMRKFRNVTDTFCRLKDYGFFPTIESCNAYMSSLLDLNRMDIALAFYREMQRYSISSNVYALNMIMCAYCKLGKLDKAVDVFKEMEGKGFSPNIASYNTLIAGYCNKALLSFAIKLKNTMGNQAGNSEMGSRIFDEMLRNRVKADILTYNALILGLCKEGKTKKAAYLVKELDKEKFVPNASTFSALISGQCMRKNSDRAFLLYKSMCGKSQLAKMLCSEMEARRLMPAGFEKSKTFNFGAENENKASGDN